MKSSTHAGFEQDYNAQVAVDQGSMLIVGWALSYHPNDSQEAEPTLAAIPSTIGTPEAAALDAGYFGPATLGKAIYGARKCTARTSDRDHQRGPRLPSVLLAWDSSGGWRMVPGLLGFQSQALPYLIPSVVVNGDTFPDHSVVTLFEFFSPTTVVHSGVRASALNDMHAGLAAAMVAVLFSPTSS